MNRRRLGIAMPDRDRRCRNAWPAIFIMDVEFNTRGRGKRHISGSGGPNRLTLEVIEYSVSSKPLHLIKDMTVLGISNKLDLAQTATRLRHQLMQHPPHMQSD